MGSLHHFVSGVHNGLPQGGGICVAGDGDLLGLQIRHSLLDAWHSLTGFFHTGLAVAAHHTLYVNYGVNDS